MGRTARGVWAGAALALVLVAGVGPAQATTRAAPVAYLRGAHMSPDTPAVDVYLTAFRGGTTALWLSSVGYGDVSPYRQIQPGEYAVSMRPHGAAPSTKPALSWTIQLKQGDAYTALAIGNNASLHGTIIQDSLNAPGAGTARVRVLQASSRAGKATVTAGSSRVLARNLPFGDETAYTTVPSGSTQVRASSGTTPKLTGKATIDIAGKSVMTVVVLDSKSSGIEVHSVIDAAGPAVQPTGAVPAGGGGTAVARSIHFGAFEPSVLAGLSALLLLGAAGLLRRPGRR